MRVRSEGGPHCVTLHYIHTRQSHEVDQCQGCKLEEIGSWPAEIFLIPGILFLLVSQPSIHFPNSVKAEARNTAGPFFRVKFQQS